MESGTFCVLRKGWMMSPRTSGPFGSGNIGERATGVPKEEALFAAPARGTNRSLRVILFLPSWRDF
jgi:hypothetical protein